MNGLGSPSGSHSRADNEAEATGAAGSEIFPLVAIVILNWNGKAYLQQFLPFVLASSYSNKRVIVADNASTDDSIPFFSGQFSRSGSDPQPQQ